MEYFSLFDVKFKNRQAVFNYIYKFPDCSKQSIAAALNLSLPTVSQHLKFFLDAGFITVSGYLPSAVGRRAALYSVIPASKIAIGIEILPFKIYITALDLYGNKLAKLKHYLNYSPDQSYFSDLKDVIYQFIAQNRIAQDALLGIGIGLQGLTSPDGKKITYGEIINSTGLSIDIIQQYFSCPCYFLHDCECAVMTELWEEKEPGDMTYVFLGHHLGGTIILDNKIQKGATGKMGTFEHMTLIPNGQRCYCGQYGCAECYCSLNSLLDSEEADWEAFFEKKQNGDEKCLAKWHTYLDYLSMLINNLYMVFESDVVLGGHAAPYFGEEDLSYLRQKVTQRTPFKDSVPRISLGKCYDDEISVGAALFFIKQFLTDSLPDSQDP